MDFIIKNSKRENFTIIANEFLNDTTISLAAKGLGVYLLSKPKDWVINLNFLIKELKIGRDSIKKYMDELVTKRYMYKMRLKPFTRKGEQAIYYYISDSKEDLYRELGLNEVEDKQLKWTESTLPVSIPSNNEIESYLDGYLDATTKDIFLKLAPNMSITEFNTLYAKCQKEKKYGYAKSLKACLILAVQNKWIFKTKERYIKDDEKKEQILKSNLSYYKELHTVCKIPQNECLEIFRRDNTKYGEERVERYIKLLKELLEQKRN